MGASLMTEQMLEAVVPRKLQAAAAIQRYHEPVNGMYRTTLTRKQGLLEYRVQTEMLSLIGCDIKNGAKHAICEETTRSVIADSRFKDMAMAIADQMEAVRRVTVLNLVCEFWLDAMNVLRLVQMLPPTVCNQQPCSPSAPSSDKPAPSDNWQSSLRGKTRSSTSLSKNRTRRRPQGAPRPQSCATGPLPMPQGTYGSSWWQSPMPPVDLLAESSGAPRAKSPLGRSKRCFASDVGGVASKLSRDRLEMMGEGTRRDAGLKAIPRASFYGGTCAMERKPGRGELLPVSRVCEPPMATTPQSPSFESFLEATTKMPTN